MTLLNKDSEIVTMDISNLISDIKPKINENKKGKNIERFLNFFEVGDLIWLRLDEDKKYEIAMHPEVQSALVSIDPNSGKVLALVGGYSFNSSKFNRAALEFRSKIRFDNFGNLSWISFDRYRLAVKIQNFGEKWFNISISSFLFNTYIWNHTKLHFFKRNS